MEYHIISFGHSLFALNDSHILILIHSLPFQTSFLYSGRNMKTTPRHRNTGLVSSRFSLTSSFGWHYRNIV